MAKWCVYDLIGTAGTLYVGITQNPRARENRHRQNQMISEPFDFVVTSKHRTREQALGAEAARIASLNPPYNRLGRRDPGRPRLAQFKVWDKELARQLFEQGKSQREVAKAVGVDPSTLSHKFRFHPGGRVTIWKP